MTAMFVLVFMAVRVVAMFAMHMLMRVLQRDVFFRWRVSVFVLRVIVVLVVMMQMAFLAVFVRVLMSAAAIMPVPVRRPVVDVEFHALDLLPLRAVIVHVKVAEVQLAQLPFERAGFHTEVNERADHHVTTDAGDAVEEENFHVWEN